VKNDFFNLINKRKNIMNRFGNKTIELYQQLLDSGKTSAQVYDTILKAFVKRNTRKQKIEKLFNLNGI
jgi:hypothetical protein